MITDLKKLIRTNRKLHYVASLNGRCYLQKLCLTHGWPWIDGRNFARCCAAAPRRLVYGGGIESYWSEANSLESPASVTYFTIRFLGLVFALIDLIRALLVGRGNVVWAKIEGIVWGIAGSDGRINLLQRKPRSEKFSKSRIILCYKYILSIIFS